MTAWIDHLLRGRLRYLLLAAGISIAAYFASRDLKFDRSLENMFAPSDPVLAPYLQLKRSFGGNEVVLIAYQDSVLLEDEGLDRLRQLQERLAKVPGVHVSISLADIPRTLTSKSPGLFGFSTSSLGETRERVLKLSEGFTVGSDRQTAGIVCLLEWDPSAASLTSPSESLADGSDDAAELDSKTHDRAATIAQLRAIAEEQGAETVVTGEPVMVSDGFRLVEEDGKRLGTASTALLMGTIILCFRSIRWVLLPLVVVVASLFCTEALLAVTGLRLSMVSSMLWAIITVIGVATTIHLTVGFREARRDGESPEGALRTASVKLAAPIIWACLTDAAGFGSLMVASVGTVQDFGIMMAVGSIVVLVGIAVFTPGMALLGGFVDDPRVAWGERHLGGGLRWMVEWIERRPLIICIAAAVLTVSAIVGSARMDVETDFTKNFREGSPIVQGYQFVETHLGGAGVWDVLIPVPAEEDPTFLDRVANLQRELRSSGADPDGDSPGGISKVISLVDFAELLPLAQFHSKSDLENLVAAVRPISPIADSLYGTDPQSGRPWYRIMLRSPERQSAQSKRRVVENVKEIAGRHFPGAEVTGFFVLLTRLIESIVRDQWISFMTAISAIFFMALLAFRDPLLALIALVPNVLSILFLTGIMGWLDLKINMGAAMIAAVSMGLSVDSSIHYLTDFLRRRREGKSFLNAIDEAHQTVGMAMIFSTLALMVGFGVLCTSSFVPTIYFGALMSLAMLGGLLGNLVILPALLCFKERIWAS